MAALETATAWDRSGSARPQAARGRRPSTSPSPRAGAGRGAEAAARTHRSASACDPRPTHAGASRSRRRPPRQRRRPARPRRRSRRHAASSMTQRASLPRPGRQTAAALPACPGGRPTAYPTGPSTCRRDRSSPRTTRVSASRGGAGPLGPRLPVMSSYHIPRRERSSAGPDATDADRRRTESGDRPSAAGDAHASRLEAVCRDRVTAAHRP